jgi:hypothetical protein
VAGLTSTAGEQLRAIAILRWQLSLNSLRSVRGRLNLVSRGIAGLLVIGAGLGGGIAIAAAAWNLTVQHKAFWLALPFWLISIFWQIFPVMASAFTQNLVAASLSPELLLLLSGSSRLWRARYCYRPRSVLVTWAVRRNMRC